MKSICTKLKIKQKLRSFFSRKRLFFLDKRCFSSFRFLKQQLFFYMKKTLFQSVFFYHRFLSFFLFVGREKLFFYRLKGLKSFNFNSLSFFNRTVNKHFFANAFFCKKLFI